VAAAAVVLMGVAGTGKTTVGRLLAEDVGWLFLDADDFHSPANVEKMRRGEPLDDADRQPWLAALRGRLAEELGAGRSVVLACSALKTAYRERLSVDERVRFVHLKGDPDLLRRRLGERPAHYFGPGLLESQLKALEEPKDVLTLDVTPSPAELVREIEQGLQIISTPGC
jgi:gluconokinase